MFNLIRNEQMKLFIQKSTWIMLIVLAVLAFFSVLLLKPDEANKYTDNNWQEKLQKENKAYEKDVKNPDFAGDASFIEYKMGQIKTNNYYLKNDIKPLNYGAWQYVLDAKDFLSMLSLLTIIVAAGIVANEYRWGTIKLLLIRPMTRTKILLSKYISVLLFALISLVLFIVVAWVAGAIFVGVDGLNPKVAIYSDGKVLYESIIGIIFKDYGFKLVNLVMMATFAFAISTLFKNSALSIGISIFLMMAGSSIVVFLANKSWAKYILFANTDLTQYTTGVPLFKGTSLGFSITVLVVYYIVFLAVSWISFTKRDVAGA
ncbi:ABC transporter permease subunit [Aciduricibacillus chroicocephali]|uniref:ABC transporter permease subunit n=1 Tax=Aciduricibacillus chroicocephali TaxID=3054939 RepID=A0ABY9KWD7_9BACI|nr:ABC transporter permease subunit [Bacillaceae bacterium 44XB]